MEPRSTAAIPVRATVIKAPMTEEIRNDTTLNSKKMIIKESLNALSTL